MREFAPAGDLGLDIVVVVEGGGGEAGRGHRGGEADRAADQSELNILPSNHSSSLYRPITAQHYTNKSQLTLSA